MTEEKKPLETAEAEKPVEKTPEAPVVSETVKAILARNERNTEQLVKEEEKKEEVVDEKVEEKKDDKPAPILITEEMIKDFPFAKSLVGKPLSAMMEAQRSLLRTWNKDRQRIAEYEKVKVTPPTDEKLPTLDEFVQKGLDDAKIDFPDPLEDPKGFKAANRKESILAQKLADEWRDKKNQPEKKQAESERQTRAEREQLETTVKILNAKIPDKTTDELDTIATQYAEEVAEILQENPNLYNGKPELLASDISSWYYASELKRVNLETQQKIDNAKKNTTAKVKAAMKDQTTTLQSVKDGEPKKELSSNLQKIKERAERMNSQ